MDGPRKRPRGWKDSGREPCGDGVVVNRTATARPLGGRLNLICSGAAALGCALLFTFASSPASAAEEENGVLVISGSDEAFDSLREVVEPGRSAETVEDVIKKFFPETVVHEGTYPASEALEHDFDLRREKPEEIKYSGRFFGKYSKDEISDTEKWEKEFELNLSKGNLDAFFRATDANSFNYKTEPFRLSKARLRYRWEDGKATLGSFGTVFGRGLGLNLFEERFLDFDNELEGVLLEQKVGDAEFQALYGTRKEIIDPRASTVSGLKAATSLGDNVDVEAYLVNVEFPFPSHTVAEPKLFDYKIVGADAQIKFGEFKIYGETVHLKRDAVEFAPGNVYDSSGQDGHGTYLTASYSTKGLAITGEYKEYRGLTHPFSTLPPIRRWQEKSAADPNDDYGYGLSVNWNPLGDGSFFNFGSMHDNSVERGRPYSEFFATYNSPGGQDFSYIAEYWQVLDFDQHHEITRLTLNQILSEDWTGTMYLENERLDNNYSVGYTDYIIEPELAYQSIANLIYRWEKTGTGGPEQKSTWKLWELKLHPDELTEIHISTGSRREGFVCSGGVCRQEPEFEGFRLDFTRRF